MKAVNKLSTYLILACLSGLPGSVNYVAYQKAQKSVYNKFQKNIDLDYNLVNTAHPHILQARESRAAGKPIPKKTQQSLEEISGAMLNNQQHLNKMSSEISQLEKTYPYAGQKLTASLLGTVFFMGLGFKLLYHNWELKD